MNLPWVQEGQIISRLKAHVAEMGECCQWIPKTCSSPLGVGRIECAWDESTHAEMMRDGRSSEVESSLTAKKSRYSNPPPPCLKMQKLGRQQKHSLNAIKDGGLLELFFHVPGTEERMKPTSPKLPKRHCMHGSPTTGTNNPAQLSLLSSYLWLNIAC